MSDFAIGAHDAVLAELLELGLAAAREVQARLLAAEDARQACDLSLAFNRISRSVRQTVALQAKLGRERKRQDREDAAEIERSADARASRRRAQVCAAVERAIWTEAEDDEAERLLDELDDLVSEEALYEGFGDEPVAVHIGRLCLELGLQDSSLGGRARQAPAGGEARSAIGPASQSAPSLGDGASDAGVCEWRSSA